MPKWEYTVREFYGYEVDAESVRLNQLGSDGWELVHVEPLLLDFDEEQTEQPAPLPPSYRLWFKRPIP